MQFTEQSTRHDDSPGTQKRPFRARREEEGGEREREASLLPGGSHRGGKRKREKEREKKKERERGSSPRVTQASKTEERSRAKRAGKYEAGRSADKPNYRSDRSLIGRRAFSVKNRKKERKGNKKERGSGENG